ALKDASSVIRVRAAEALWQVDPGNKEVLPVLIEGLKERTTCVSAAAALGRMGVAARPAVPILAERLADKDPAARRSCLQALAALGSEAKEAVPAVAAILKDSDQALRLEAAFALVRTGAGEQAVPVLAEGVWNPDYPLRRRALGALYWLGPQAKAAAPPRARAVEDPLAHDRPWVAETLAHIDPSQSELAIRQLTAMAQVRRLGLSPDAALSLWRLNPKNEVSIPVLIDLFQMGPAGSSSQAAECLG